MVDDNADTTRLLLADTSLLELIQGEATALTELAVVADGLAADGGAEELKGADAKGCGLGLAGGAAAELAAGLVEPGADAALPVLPEVVGVEDVVVFPFSLFFPSLLFLFPISPLPSFPYLFRP